MAFYRLKPYILLMPASNNYTAISVMKGIKADLVARQEGNDTYSTVIRRLIDERDMNENELKDRLDHLEKVQQQQSRLLVRMAVAQGVEKEQIPDNLAEYEAWGSDSPFAPSKEETVDVNSEEKQEEFDQYDQETITAEDLKQFEADNNGGDSE